MAIKPTCPRPHLGIAVNTSRIHARHALNPLALNLSPGISTSPQHCNLTNQTMQANTIGRYRRVPFVGNRFAIDEREGA